MQNYIINCDKFAVFCRRAYYCGMRTGRLATAKKILASVVLIAVVAASVTFAVRHNDNTAQHTTGTLRVAASYYPLYEFAQQVGKDKITATNITPGSSEPHDYEPPANVLADAQKAAVFVYNGGHMEPWVGGFLHDYRHTVVKASSGIDLLAVNEGGGAAVKVQDPHFWLDPVLAQQIVNNIRDGFSKADPANAVFYAKNAAAYNAKLAALDSAYRSGLSHCSLHTVISAHDAFSYLGRRYNVQIVPIAGLSPDEEPSAAKLAELTRLAKQDGIAYIFFERLVSPRLAHTIAAETGAQTLVFDTIEGISNADQKQGKNYLSIQQENLANLRTALACQ